MAQRLSNMKIGRVDLVDKGANGRSFALFKRDADEDIPDGLIARIAKGVADLLRIPDDPISKEAKTESGKAFPASDYAYVPEPDKPSTWKLRLTETPGGAPTASMVGRAIAAVGPKGYRGQKADIPSGDLASVKSKLRAAWKKANPDKEAADMPEAIAKAMTFDEIRAGDELREEMPAAFYTLQDAVWSAMWATDEAGQTLPLEQRIALVSTDLEQFRTYLVGVLETGLVKRERGGLAGQSIAAIVAKIGRKISGARLERLKNAATALSEVLAEVEAEKEAATEKRDSAQEDEMTPEELTAAVAKANEPLVARIEALEKGAEPAAGDAGEHKEPVVKNDGAEDEVTLATAVEAIGKLADRIEKVEKTPGGRTSQPGNDGAAGDVKKGLFTGFFN